MKRVIYPGSFDPITLGHMDIIERAARTWDEVVVAILSNPRKSPLFTLEERLQMLRESVAHLPNVRVDSSSGLLVNFVRASGANAIIKGLRPIQDFEYEWQMGVVNMELDSSIETFFLMSRKEYSYLSSSIVRELAMYGGAFDSLVPVHVAARLREKVTRTG